MLCKDPFVAYLKSYGYNVVRLPKADLKPLEVISKQGRELGRLGAVSDVMNPGDNIALPKINKDIAAANISGQRTSDMSLGLGLNILGTIIGAMGGSTLGLDLKYKQAKSVQFEFQDVLSDSVRVTQLDKFLTDSDVNPFSKSVSQLLEADEIYIVTSTIKSKKFTVQAKTASGAAVDVSVPEIQGVVGGKVKVKGEGETASKVTYEGDVPLVFGFQAVRLYYDQGTYTAFKPLESTVGLKDLEHVEEDGTDRLMTEAPFVNLEN